MNDLNALQRRLGYRGGVQTSLRAGARASLRRATAGNHARVDAFFRNGLREPADYRVYLRGIHAMVRALERGLQAGGLSPAWRAWPQDLRLLWLGQDLATLGLAALPDDGLDLGISGDAEAAGALYVVEGSALGARLLLPDAVAQGWTALGGAGFLHRHAGSGANHRWRAFVQALEDAAFDEEAERRMRDTAASTFAYVEHQFARARQVEGR